MTPSLGWILAAGGGLMDGASSIRYYFENSSLLVFVNLQKSLILYGLYNQHQQ